MFSNVFTSTSAAQARLWPRHLRVALLGLLCTYGHLAFAQASPEPPAEPTTPAGQPAQHVEHFGFYASAMGHWNFTEALAPVTTLTWVHVHGGDGAEAGARRIVERVREARDNGVQAVLSLEPFLFADDRGNPLPDQVTEDFLIELRAQLEVEELLDTVLMLYPKDEPFREFRRARDPDFIEQYITGEVYEDIDADLDTVLAHLAAVFPEKPRGVILSGLELHHRFFGIPEGYDWIGFDCYASLFEACEGRSFVQLYGRLLAHMTPAQRLMAVPESWALWGYLERDDWPETLARRLAHHWEMIMAEPRFVAVIPFLWSFEAPGDVPGIGLDRFAETWDERSAGAGTAFIDLLLDMGTQVKFGESAYPNLSWADTEDHPARTEELERGEILEITDDGLVRVQAIDGALPHKNLRVQLALRDSLGRLLMQTPMVRTDLRMPIAVEDLPDDGVLLGTHGLEWQIPAPLLSGYAGRTLTVELLTFADGPGTLLAHRTTRRFEAMPQVGWSIRYDGVLFHPDLWNLTDERLGPVFGAPGHGMPAIR